MRAGEQHQRGQPRHHPADRRQGHPPGPPWPGGARPGAGPGRGPPGRRPGRRPGRQDDPVRHRHLRRRDALQA
nr:MAG TPA: hypothetical protein [Caudoviricetes sp.]